MRFGSEARGNSASALRLVRVHAGRTERRDVIRLVDEMDTEVSEGRYHGMVDLDMKLHETMCQMSGHRRLHKVWSRMADQLRTFFAAADLHYDDRQLVERHRVLITAVASGDQDNPRSGRADLSSFMISDGGHGQSEPPPLESLRRLRCWYR